MNGNQLLTLKSQMNNNRPYELEIERVPRQPDDRQQNSQSNKKEPNILQLFRFADRNDKIMIVIASLCSLGAGGLTPVYVYYVGKANEFLSEVSSSDINNVINDTGLKFIYFGLAIFIALTIAHILWFISGEKQERTIRKAYLRALMTQEQEWHDSINQAELASTFSSQIKAIRHAISEHAAILLQIVGCCIVSLILIFATAWLLSFVCLGMVPLLIFVSYFYFRSYQGKNKKYKRIYEKAGSLSEQTIYAIKTVKMMNGEAGQERKYNKQLGKIKSKYYNLSSKIGASVALMNICFFLLNGLAYWFGSECLMQSSICPSSISGQNYQPVTVSVIYYVLLSCYYMVVLISPTANGLSQGKNAAAKIFTVIDRQPRIGNNPDCWKLQQLKGIIELVNVSFAYPKEKNKKVLDRVSMKFEVWNTALMGESGCGKSTILQLILRIYDPDEGAILLDGHDIRTLDLEWLRDQIGYVGQEPVLFAGTIRDNLLLYCPSATDQEIDATLKCAEIYDFIYKELQLKLDTYVGVGGQMISGGQKQRVAIARALLRHPRILILDEATSALDKRNERKILTNLQKFPHRLTTIAVSHRLQVSEISDYVYVLEKGVIAEQGRFRQLELYNFFVGEPSTYQFLQLNKQIAKSQCSFRQTVSTIKEIKGSKIKNEDQNPSKSKMMMFNFKQKYGQELKRSKDSELINYANEVLEGPKDPEQSSMAVIKRSLHNLERSRIRPQKEELSMIAILKKLFSFNKNKPLLVFALITSLLIGLTIPTVSYLSAQLYFALTQLNYPLTYNEGFTKRNTALFFFIGVAVAYFFIYFMQVVSTYMIGNDITRNIRKHLYQKFLKMPISWHEKLENNPGVLISALGEDCESINELASMLLFIFIIIVTGVFSCYLIGLVFQWQITLLGLAFLPFIVFCAIAKSYLKGKLDTLIQEVRHSSNIIVTETLISIKTVTALNITNQLHKHYCELEDRPNDQVTQMGIKMGIVNAFGHFINYATLGALFFFTGKLLSSSNYTMNLENAIIALFEAFNVAFAISSNYHFIPNLKQASVIAGKVFNYLEEEDEDMMQEREHSRMLTDGIIAGEIVFDKVSFSYQNRDNYIFQDLCFTLEKKKILAVVGKSGCGKSTIINILQRFYSPKKGVIRIDGIDIRDFDIHYLRSKLGIVSQEPVLINGSIRENILYGKRQATEEEVRRAAQMANAMEFIIRDKEGPPSQIELLEESGIDTGHNSSKDMRKPKMGFDKSVGFNGSNLSGGQKQRIAIARMLVKTPTILMFDEATSALDYQNEARMQALLDRISAGKTTLTISHKLDLVKGSDYVIMIDTGRIVEQGSYNELVNKKGYFFNLQNGQDSPIKRRNQ